MSEPKLKLSKAIGLFGGAFDPFHLGHLEILTQAVNFCSFEAIHLIPTYEAAHRGHTLHSYQWRLQSLKSLCDSLVTEDGNIFTQSNTNLIVSEIESQLPSPSYTYRTIEAFRKIYGSEQQIAFFIGADSLNSLSSWHEWQYLVDECHFLVFPRPGFDFSIDPLIHDQ